MKPKNVTILTGGSRGDTQPYIALGSGLKEAGYNVRVATFEVYRDFVEKYGLEFYPIKGDFSKVVSNINVDKAMKADNPFKILLSFREIRSHVFNLQKDFYNSCEGTDAIIYHPGVTIGYFIAQHLKVPSFFAPPFPMTATKQYPSLIFYDKLRLGKKYNLLTHKLLENIMWFASKSPVKKFWKNKFGKKPKNFKSPFSRQNTESLPTITACSNQVFPKPEDWSEHVHNTGYWFLDENEPWQPPKDLKEFLEKGNPPVYVGFGSIRDPKSAGKTTAMILKALKVSRQRGILATGWEGMTDNVDVPENVFMLKSVPHTWLFPKMAIVVHHGGAGTTAAGFRAGIPSIIIPHTNDQFAWSRRAFELGVGPKTVPRKKLTAEKLADFIKLALSNEIKESAKILGKKIRMEDGVKTAVEIIKRTIS